MLGFDFDEFPVHFPRGWKSLFSSQIASNLLFSSVLSLSLLLFYFLRVSHTSVSRWSFIEGWVPASLLRSPELFSVFRPTSTMQKFWSSPIVLQFPTLLALLGSICRSLQVYQLQLVWPSTYLVLGQDLRICHFLVFFYFLCDRPGW